MRKFASIVLYISIALLQSELMAKCAISAEQLCLLGHDAVRKEAYDKAIAYYQRGQILYTAEYGTYSPEYALTEAYIGYAFYRKGNLIDAEKCYTQSLQRLSAIEGGCAHPLYLHTLNNLATLMLDLGDYALALKYYERIQESLNTESVSLYSMTLKNNIATAHYLMHNNTIADSIYHALLPQISVTDSAQVELYRHVACNLARSAIERKNYSEADSCLSVALSTFSVAEHNSVAYTYVLDMCALTKQLTGSYLQAERLMKKIIAIRKKTLGILHLDYIMALNNLAHLYAIQLDYTKANYWYAQEFPLRARSVATNLLYMTERQRLMYVEKMDLVFENYLEFAYQSYMNNPSVSAYAYDDVLFYKGLLLNTSNIIKERLNHGQDCTIIDDWRNAWLVKHEDIQNTLSEHQVAVEFADFPIGEDDRQYIALLLRRESINPLLIPLCKESDLAFLSAASKAHRIYDYEEDGKNLYQLVWQPITNYIDTTDTIYYSFSGVLHNVNLDAIPMAEDKYLSDRYHLVRTSSTRQLLEKRSLDNCHSAVLVGGVRYDVRTSSTELKERIPFLQNTLEETYLLSEILDRQDINTRIYTEYEASKDSVCALSGVPIDVLHIATHGYYVPKDSTAQMSSLRRQLFRCSLIPHVGLSDGMKRSGLLMAEADAINTDSTSLAFSKTILTARDISLLDFSATQMVVLSACETAKGDISSDGIFGLQRAFKQAGVKTIVMTLWRVNDIVTRNMMLAFYKYWMTTGHKRESFMRAIREIRNKYPEPEYWAAYIMLE